MVTQISVQALTESVAPLRPLAHSVISVSLYVGGSLTVMLTGSALAQVAEEAKAQVTVKRSTSGLWPWRLSAEANGMTLLAVVTDAELTALGYKPEEAA